MSEQVKDFIPEQKEIKLYNDSTLIIIAPTNRWWFEWLIPKYQSLQLSTMDAETNKQILKDIKDGELKPETLSNLGQGSLPLLELLTEFLMYHTGKDRDYIMDKMPFEDTCLIVTTWLKMVDINRVIGFFVGVSRIIPTVSKNTKGTVKA